MPAGPLVRIEGVFNSAEERRETGWRKVLGSVTGDGTLCMCGRTGCR